MAKSARSAGLKLTDLKSSRCLRSRSRLEDIRHVDDQIEDASVKNTEINEEWKESIILGARKELITVSTLSDLIDHAPQSAIDLLDMLTTDPKEENKQHNPLPVRANIPYSQEACRLSCSSTAYIYIFKKYLVRVASSGFEALTRMQGNGPGKVRSRCPGRLSKTD